MGKKDGELWDDSALIDAFEDAVSSYKLDDDLKYAVHIGHITAEVIVDEEDVKSCVDGTSSDADASSNLLAEATMLSKDNEVDEAVSNGTLEIESDSNVQRVAEADYNSLVNQYYELQEKLQLTWQQLQLYGYSSEQCPEVGLSDSTAGGVKENSVLPSDVIHADIVTNVMQNNDAVGKKPEPLCCGCPYNQSFISAGVQGTRYGCCDYPSTSKCVVYSSCSASACRRCSDAVPGYGPEKSLTLEDNDLIRAAMGAAEKAISSIKIQTVDHQEESSTGSIAKSAEDNGCETNLSTVLNAWFSAGLYTGKYLAEQSTRRHKG